MRKLALAFGLLTSAFSVPALAFETEMLQDNGPSSNRVNIVIVGDGYRTEDQALLREHALRFTDQLWQQSSFGNYRQFFNVKLVHSISADDGAVNGFNPPSQPTLFQSFFNCSGIDRLLCIGDTSKLYDVLAQDAPEYDSRFDIVLVSVNDLKYGGAGGGYATTSADPSAPWIAVHELGHSFAGLADEYDYGGNQQFNEFFEPNVTIFSQREQIKWKIWIEPSTPVPTPQFSGYFDKVGVFEGAKYSPVGHFRPWENCLMRALGVPFCPVCSEALIWNVYDKTDPIEAHFPASNSVVLGSSPQEFSFTGPKPAGNVQRVEWLLDGNVIATNVDRVNVSGLSVGSHTLVVRTKDQTSAVRRDPDNVLASQFQWTIDARGGDNGAGGASGSGGTAGSSGSGGGASGGTGGTSSSGGSTSSGGTTGSGGSGGSGSGTCGGLPEWFAGTTAADVKHNGQRFHCTVAPWCSMTGASAVLAWEPGVGYAWSQAWELKGSCD
jgi:hypothetical protein